MAMAKKLTDLKITSADLVDAGANPDAKINLFKRDGAQGGGTGAEPGGDPAGVAAQESFIKKLMAALQSAFGGKAGVAKGDAQTFSEALDERALREVANEIWSAGYAFEESLVSILFDDELGSADKASKMNASLDEFAEYARSAIQSWAEGSKAGEGKEAVAKSQAQQAAIDEVIAKYAGAGSGDSGGDDGDGGPQEEVCDVKIDKSKMAPDELAAYEALEKKYGVAEAGADEPGAAPDGAGDAPGAPGMHPEVRKALADAEEMRKKQGDEIEGLKKNLEIASLEATAKK
jgi:hypothetical protein